MASGKWQVRSENSPPSALPYLNHQSFTRRCCRRVRRGFALAATGAATAKKVGGCLAGTPAVAANLSIRWTSQRDSREREILLPFPHPHPSTLRLPCPICEKPSRMVVGPPLLGSMGSVSNGLPDREGTRGWQAAVGERRQDCVNADRFREVSMLVRGAIR